IVGGSGVVTESIANHLRGFGLTVNRMSGSDRFLTNLSVNEAFFATEAPRVLMATGMDFPDALSATVLAGRNSLPMLLTESRCVYPGTANFIDGRGTTRIDLVGGEGVLSPGGVARLVRC